VSSNQVAINYFLHSYKKESQKNRTETAKVRQEKKRVEKKVEKNLLNVGGRIAYEFLTWNVLQLKSGAILPKQEGSIIPVLGLSESI
jgi:hypothetical protein